MSTDPLQHPDATIDSSPTFKRTIAVTQWTARIVLAAFVAATAAGAAEAEQTDTEFLFPLLADLPEETKLTALEGPRGRELSNSINGQKISNWQREVAPLSGAGEFAVKIEGRVLEDATRPFAKRWVVLCPISDDQGQPLLRHRFHDGVMANPMVLTDQDGHFSLDASVAPNETCALSTQGGIMALPLTVDGRAVSLAFTGADNGKLFSLGDLRLRSDKPISDFFPSRRPSRPKAASAARIWTDRKGRQVQAEFIAAARGKVTVKRTSDGKLFEIPLDWLSDSDQAFVQSRNPAASTLAPIGGAGNTVGATNLEPRDPVGQVRLVKIESGDVRFMHQFTSTGLIATLKNPSPGRRFLAISYSLVPPATLRPMPSEVIESTKGSAPDEGPDDILTKTARLKEKYSTEFKLRQDAVATLLPSKVCGGCSQQCKGSWKFCPWCGEGLERK